MGEEDRIFAGLLIVTIRLIVLRRENSNVVKSLMVGTPINHRYLNQQGFSYLLQKIKADLHMFFQYTRMKVLIFNKLLEKARPFWTKKIIEL